MAASLPALPSASVARFSIPILMYHHVRVYKNKKDPMGERLSVTPVALAAQLKWLAAHNYQRITLDELIALREGHSALAKKSKPIVLSFDDGYDDAYTEAMPLLFTYRARGVFYIPSGFLGKSGYMNETQVWALDRHGMQIAAHTVGHADLPVLTPEKQRYELLASKQALEKLTGHSVVHFAYPYGHYNSAVVAMLKELGYKSASTTAGGFVHEQADSFELPRFHMQSEMRLGDFLL